MLSTESRMRGDMQVRFGGRYGKTYCRKAVRRSVPSLRLGKGGNIIALAEELYASDYVPYLLNKIAERVPHIRPVSFSFRQQASEPSFQQLEVGELTHPALFNYLQERGIDTALAKPECKELHFIHNGKPISLSASRMWQEDMKCVTLSSRAASHRKTSAISVSRESEREMPRVRGHDGLPVIPHVTDEELPDYAEP